MDREREIFISLDVETDGKICGLSSMLSLGAAAIGWDTQKRKWIMSHTFSDNVKPLIGCSQDSDTMKFWADNPAAWAAVISNRRFAGDVMETFVAWTADVKRHWGRKLTAVAAPAAFDFPFVRYYLIRFTGSDRPFGHSCLDIKSVASTLLKLPYADSSKRNYPKHWFQDGFPHTHIAVDDAVEQGHIWTHIMDAANNN